MHLFAGHGGGLLADLILGHKPVVAVEWDGYACQVLRERAADGWFPGLRVWEGDVRLFDPSEYAGSVDKIDVIHAGFPCTDISVAGNQLGLGEGTRSGLYREVLRIAGVVRPKYIFLENVAAILSNGLGTVLGDLAALGMDCRWLCIRASDVGAKHHRDRWFLLANTDNYGNGEPRKGQSIFNRNGNCPQEEPKRHELGAWSKSSGEILADSKCQRLQGQGEYVHAKYSAQSCDWKTTRSEYGRSSDFWATESNVGRVANGVPHRVHRLKGLGNAQVPLQAATAYRLLGGC